MADNSISKSQAVEALKKAGYPAENKNGIVTVYYSEAGTGSALLKEVKQILADAGYAASFAITYSNAAAKKDISESAKNYIIEE